MSSIIETSSAVSLNSMPTPASLKPGAELITAKAVGPAAVSNITNHGYSAVESAQISAEQSYSAMASATAGGGTDVTVEFMLEQNGKAL